MAKCRIVTALSPAEETRLEPDLLTNAPLFGKINIVTKFIDLAQEYGMNSFNLNVYWRAGQLDIYFIVNAEDNF